MANPRNFHDTFYGITNNNGVPAGTVLAREAYFNASDYDRRMPKGPWRPPTNYSMSAFREVLPTGIVIHYYRNWDGTYIASSSQGPYTYGTNPNAATALTTLALKVGYSGNLVDFPSDLEDVSRAKAWSDLKRQDVNYGQAWAERGQTASLVTANIGRIITGVRNLRRNPAVLKDIARGANKIVKDLPNWWLEVVFGWKPLVSDIHGALQDLEQTGEGHYGVTAIGKAKMDLEYHTAIGNDDNSKEHIDAKIFHGAKCRIDAYPSNDALISAASMGITNPLSLAWELLPWSFALDWLLPVGQYFDNLDAPLGWDIRGMSTSCFTKVDVQRRGLNSDDFWTRTTNSFTGNMRYRRLNRNAAVVLPWEIVPHFKDPFNSATRVGTALSLLSQLLGKGPRRPYH